MVAVVVLVVCLVVLVLVGAVAGDSGGSLLCSDSCCKQLAATVYIYTCMYSGMAAARDCVYVLVVPYMRVAQYHNCYVRILALGVVPLAGSGVGAVTAFWATRGSSSNSGRGMEATRFMHMSRVGIPGTYYILHSIQLNRLRLEA